MGAAVRAAGNVGACVMIKVTPGKGRSLQDGRPAARPPFPFHSPTPAYFPQCIPWAIGLTWGAGSTAR